MAPIRLKKRDEGAEPGTERRIRLVSLLIFVLVVVVFSIFASGVLSIREVWNTVLLEPMMNFLIMVAKPLGRNMGLSIIVLTIVARIVTLPLLLRQMRSSIAMRQMQPRIEELRNAYGDDTKGLQKELASLYKERGYSPVGCLFNTVIQFPIWVAVYQALLQTMAYIPENLLGLSDHLYPWSLIREALPLHSNFLWLNLVKSDILIAILTAATIWVLQKMSTQPTAGAQQQTMNRVMLWGLPLFFGFLALVLPSGLPLYWVSSNIILIIIQARMTGWGTLSIPFLTARRSVQASETTGGKDMRTGGPKLPKKDDVIEKGKGVGKREDGPQ